MASVDVNRQPYAAKRLRQNQASAAHCERRGAQGDCHRWRHERADHREPEAYDHQQAGQRGKPRQEGERLRKIGDRNIARLQTARGQIKRVKDRTSAKDRNRVAGRARAARSIDRTQTTPQKARSSRAQAIATMCPSASSVRVLPRSIESQRRETDAIAKIVASIRSIAATSPAAIASGRPSRRVLQSAHAIGRSDFVGMQPASCRAQHLERHRVFSSRTDPPTCV